MRKLRVLLEVTLNVDDEELEENGEPMTDEEVANSLSVLIPGGSFLSVADEAIDIVGQKVAHFSRILSRTT